VDLVITNATVVTMNASREVLRDAEVVIEGDTLVRVGPARRRVQAGLRRVLDARGKVVLPGLIHSHLHACQTLLRNHADGLGLLDWLRERVWPFEASHDAASMRASADLTFLECLESGATSVLDMGSARHYGAVFESARDAGIRLVGGKCMMDAGQGVPAALRETTHAALTESARLLDAWHGQAGGRLRYALAPRFVLACTEGLLRETVAMARARGVRIHTHAAESTEECDAVRTRTGLDYLEYLEKVGLLGPGTTLAHCVWLTANEQRLLRESHTCVAHCPSANLKLGSGIARVPELLAQGVPVGLGADGAPCNNNLDLWVELRLAALLHLPRVGPTGFPAMRALELATLNGARALGLEGVVGAVREGFKADLTLVDLEASHLTPVAGDLVSTLVYSAQSRDVTDVVVNGEVVVKNRRVLTLDARAVRARAKAHADRLLADLGESG
jgi:cytosine/adenosine deaminase-related metal-dependent hydrolase